MQASKSSSFDLSNYLKFEVTRKSEDSAPKDKLSFKVESNGIDGDELKFSVIFDNPDSVSIGSRKDELVMEIVDPRFFSSSGKGKSVQKREVVSPLPRMLSAKEVAETMTVVSGAV